MAEIETVEATLSIEMYVTCPNEDCGNYIDLLEEKETLIAQTEGYWSGHTIYNIVVDAGLLKDSRQGKKKLTTMGKLFCEQYPESD